MSIEKVQAFLAAKGMADRVITFEASTATVELAAEAVGVEPGRIAKTMSFLVDGAPHYPGSGLGRCLEVNRFTPIASLCAS